jgi:hypothetical protein
MKFLNIISFSVILILIGCDSLTNKKSYNYDDELIDQIRNAQNKIEIEISQLPESAIATIEEFYASDIFLSEMLAEELGYELTVNKLDSESDDFFEIYFDLNGNKLESEYDKDNWECFEFVYPITFIMSDGSSIIVSSDDEEGWTELKNWYDQNADADLKEWNLEYPVEVILESDNSTLVINNEEEMIELKEECYDK